MDTKQCKTCQSILPLTNKYWYKVNSKSKTYWRGSCKECASKTDKQWRINNKERDQLNAKTKRVRTSYGITLEEYEKAMSISNTCQICGSYDEDNASKKLNYDHCHITGKFRGVLCRSCNQSIGLLGDTAESLLKAYTYLKEFEDDNKAN